MDMIISAVDHIYDEVESYFYVLNVCLRVHWALLETCPLLYRELGTSSYQLKLLCLYYCYLAFMRYCWLYLSFIYHCALGQQRNHLISRYPLKNTSHINNDKTNSWHVLRIQCAIPCAEDFIHRICFTFRWMRLYFHHFTHEETSTEMTGNCLWSHI